MHRPISSEDLGSTIAVGQKCTAAQLPALEDATPALLCWAPSQSEIGIYVCLPRNLRRDVATLGSENDRPGEEQGPPRRVPCPNNCGMIITWHATHCCHSCQYHPGRHGPQCERLEAPPNPYGPRPAEEPPFSSLFGPPPLAFQPMPASSYPVLLDTPNPTQTLADANVSHATGSGYPSRIISAPARPTQYGPRGAGS